MLEWCSGSYLTQSKDLLLLKTPHVGSELVKTAFSVSAPNSWNVLQLSLKLETLPSLSVFKGMLSNHCVSIVLADGVVFVLIICLLYFCFILHSVLSCCI